MSIRVFDRKNQTYIEEKIYGEAAIRAAYHPMVAPISQNIIAHPLVSKAYGWAQSQNWSTKKIPDFIEKFEIPIEDFEEGPFQSFNDFFIRAFKPGKRTFVQEHDQMPAFAEGRYLAFESIDDETFLPIKGAILNLSALLGKSAFSKTFQGGPGFIARLCPVDYHRFHFPDEGKIISSSKLHGPLHSVNPIALRSMGDILFKNERHVQILETHNFKKIAMIEVGAMMVGKIVQTHDPIQPFKRGYQKGYFLFGGSTVIIVGEPGAWTIQPDILEKSQEGTECLVRLGESIAVAKRH